MSDLANGAAGWGIALRPAHCRNCHAEFLVPPDAGAPLCPNCLAARLEPIPALARNAPPELILPFTVADATLNANLERWLRDIPFKPPTLNLKELRARLVPVFFPMYLADASVHGTWNAQMGFDYLVASSQERFNTGQWVTQKLNETRIRWEPRLGEIAVKYQNVPAPALENHARAMADLGDATTFPFDTTRAVPFSSDATGRALVRAPEITNAAAWNFAQREVERRAAKDCRIASDAQHHEQFALRAVFGEPEWTLLLLPHYVTCYGDDDKKWLPVRVNGQTGYVSGVKRASLARARSWSLLLGGAAVFAFVFTLLSVLVSVITPQLRTVGILLLVVALVLCIAAPVPLVMAWQYNRRNIE